MNFLEQPQFFGVREAASNIVWADDGGSYTAQMFQEDFPQFFTAATEDEPAKSLVPPSMLEMLIGEANAAIQPQKWQTSWRYACGLYVAHYSTLYLKTYSSSSKNAAQAAASGALVGVLQSAKLGQDSVSYDSDALTKATEDWGDLNATQYGQLLATKARLVGMGGSYVI